MMETIQYILTFFFDDFKHYMELIVLILVSFVTFKVSINKSNKN